MLSVRIEVEYINRKKFNYVFVHGNVTKIDSKDHHEIETSYHPEIRTSGIEGGNS